MKIGRLEVRGKTAVRGGYEWAVCDLCGGLLDGTAGGMTPGDSLRAAAADVAQAHVCKGKPRARK